MSVASHLGVTPAAYDRRIRQLIPFYGEIIAEAAGALIASQRPIRHLVDLGIGTGALTRACLDVMPAARVTGIDVDDSMGLVARQRLGRARTRLRLVHGSFLTTEIPATDAIAASFALHHVRSRAAKARFYRRCFEALRPGGILISGDCFPPDSTRLWSRDVEAWIGHLAKSFGTRAAAAREFASWQDEDTYLPLTQEIRMLVRAGFEVEVPWRRSPFAVIAAIKRR